MITVNRIEAQDWKETFSENAHRICFEKHKPGEWDRISFALIVANGEQAMGYLTCREHDAESLYWQFGGSFPGTQGTTMTWRGYQAFVEYCRPNYKRITTLIENENVAMLKMAMKVGFRIIGLRAFGGKVYLEHLLELK